MKSRFSKILLVLSSVALSSGCNFLQVDEPTVGFVNPKRLSVVEKAWLARHKYDPQSGELQPYYRGMRYGAVREYSQENKTLTSKEWWLKDQKIDDLADAPLRRYVPTVLGSGPASATAVATPAATSAPVDPGFVDSLAPTVAPPAMGAAPGAGNSPHFEVFGSGGGASMPVFSTGAATPDLPAGSGEAPPAAGALPTIDSPFLPSSPTTATPPGLMNPLPGTALPGVPLPGAGAGAPFGVDPAAAGGGFPAAPNAGGNNPFGAPPPPGGGAPPVPPNAGGGFPAAPNAGGNNPFGAPPPPGGGAPLPVPDPNGGQGANPPLPLPF